MNKNQYVWMLVGSILVLFFITKEVILLNEELFLIIAFFIFLLCMFRFVSNPFAKQLDLRAEHLMAVIEQFMISRIEILKALKTIYKKVHTTISRGEKVTWRTHLRITQINEVGTHLRYENPRYYKDSLLDYQLNTVLIEEIFLLKDVYKSEIELYVNYCQKYFESENNNDELFEISEEEYADTYEPILKDNEN
jgi:hypothetical protein